MTTKREPHTSDTTDKAHQREARAVDTIQNTTKSERLAIPSLVTRGGTLHEPEYLEEREVGHPRPQ